jgi:SAM-dependent methyltransferase
VVDGPLTPARNDVLAAWAARVRANREQVDRYREVQDGDFYAPVASSFRFQPEQVADPVLDALQAMVRSGEDLLDIGSGGGRYALPLATRARRVIALDPSPAMLATLREGIAASRATNVEVIEARWPMADPPTVDMTLIAHVAYDIDAIGPFLDAMERATRRLCVAVLFELPPPHAIDALWPAIHGEPRASLPALPEFLALQAARGRTCDVRLFHLPAPRVDADAFLARARRLLWLREGSDKDRALRALLGREPPQPRNPRVGVASWTSA